MEGVGGSLTEFDSEESPLSTVQAATQGSKQKWLGQCSRNERCKVCTMTLKDRDCLVVDETSNPAGASPNRPVRLGTTRDR